MSIHLDTNQLIDAGKIGSLVRAQIDAWIRAGETLHTSAMAWAEFLGGPLLPGDEASALAILSSVDPVMQTTATFAALLFNATGCRSRSLADCIIAATAILANAPLSTDNLDDFQRFIPAGLILI